MISWGFAFGYSDLAVLDTFFVKPSIYIYVSGDAVDIVVLGVLVLATPFRNIVIVFFKIYRKQRITTRIAEDSIPCNYLA